jgi:hypothetical protein
VRVVGRGDDHRVESGRLQQIVVFGEELRLLAGQLVRESGGGLFTCLRPDVTQADHVDAAGAGGERLAEDVVAADAAADQAEVDLVVRAKDHLRFPRQGGRRREPHARRQELTPGHSCVRHCRTSRIRTMAAFSIRRVSRR